MDDSQQLESFYIDGTLSVVFYGKGRDHFSVFTLRIYPAEHCLFFKKLRYKTSSRPFNIIDYRAVQFFPVDGFLQLYVGCCTHVLDTGLPVSLYAI